MNQRQFDKLVNAIELEYKRLWDVLSQFKNGIDNEKFNEFYRFQYRLGSQIRDIQIVYNQLSKKERELVGKKNQLSIISFKKSISNINSKKETLKSLNYLGRSIGDAFAYFFYQFDFEHLDNHLKQSETSSFPTKLGGDGELEFIKNCKQVPDHFTIYHGITNILRIGDVSLFNLKTLKLTGIGEIKTNKIDDKNISLSVIIIGKKERSPFKDIKIKKGSLENLADGLYDEQRVKKQIHKMTNLFSENDAKLKHEIFYYRYHFNDINILITESKRYKINFKRVSDGLLLFVLKI